MSGIVSMNLSIHMTAKVHTRLLLAKGAVNAANTMIILVISYPWQACMEHN